MLTCKSTLNKNRRVQIPESSDTSVLTEDEICALFGELKNMSKFHKICDFLTKYFCDHEYICIDESLSY